jgi:hypothetical protein
MSPKFRFVCATRVSIEQFAAETMLGRSFSQVAASAELRLFPSNSTGLPVLYNIALREAASDPAVLIFIHDDVEILDLFWPVHLGFGLRMFDVIGVAGNKRRLPHQPAWYYKDSNFTIDDQEHLSGMVAHGSNWPSRMVTFFGPPYQQVKSLDGLMIACQSEVLLSKQLFFDEQFDFHFYDLDFCRQAEMCGLSLGTCSVSLLHGSGGRYGDQSWTRGYEKYLSKWKS